MSIYVFLGPTLSADVARTILDAVYLAPAAMGDVYQLVEKNASVIAIVDGLFERVPAVWHKEILYALSKGVRVLGASSMGALRAAELHPFGMEGIGQIFEAYRDGILEDDDEVAVDHASAEFNYRQISDPMVNIRDAVRQACERKLIAESTGGAIVREAKKMFYPQRSWPELADRGRNLGLPDSEIASLLRFVRDEKPNLKRDDAIELLRHIALGTHVPCRPAFDFRETVFWHKMADHLRSRNQAAVSAG